MIGMLVILVIDIIAITLTIVSLFNRSNLKLHFAKNIGLTLACFQHTIWNYNLDNDLLVIFWGCLFVLYLLATQFSFTQLSNNKVKPTEDLK